MTDLPVGSQESKPLGVEIAFNNHCRMDTKLFNRPGSKRGDKILSCLRVLSGMIAHLSAVLFTAHIIYCAVPGSTLFSWHPSLMAFAFGFLMLEAILIFSPDSSLCVKMNRKIKVRIHWILQALSMICAWLGFIAIFANKVRSNKSHFKSWHGTMGLITMLYVSIQALFGITLLYPSIVKKYNWKLFQLKVFHATFGLVGFMIASSTLILALYSNWAVANIDGFWWFLYLFSISWCGLTVMNQVSNAYLSLTKRSSGL